MIDRINGFCKNFQFLSGAGLKLIAIISMLADHVNKALIYPYLESNHGFLAFISDVFDIIGRIAFFNMNWNNVMFTLALVLVTVWIVDTLKEKMQKRSKALWYLVSVVIVLVMCIVSMSLSLDYEHHAILIGYFFYLFHDMPVFAIPFGYASMFKEPWALLGFGLTLTYNGERGKQHKMLNYWIYPVHMLILGRLRLYLGI